MKEKLRRLEDDIHQVKKEQKEYVTFHHFDAVIDPMRRTLNEVQKDIKEVLREIIKTNK
jgi:truncated hemoglobin YjbI